MSSSQRKLTGSHLPAALSSLLQTPCCFEGNFRDGSEVSGESHVTVTRWSSAPVGLQWVCKDSGYVLLYKAAHTESGQVGVQHIPLLSHVNGSLPWEQATI